MHQHQLYQTRHTFLDDANMTTDNYANLIMRRLHVYWTCMLHYEQWRSTRASMTVDGCWLRHMLQSVNDDGLNIAIVYITTVLWMCLRWCWSSSCNIWWCQEDNSNHACKIIASGCLTIITGKTVHWCVVTSNSMACHRDNSIKATSQLKFFHYWRNLVSTALL